MLTSMTRNTCLYNVNPGAESERCYGCILLWVYTLKAEG